MTDLAALIASPSLQFHFAAVTPALSDDHQVQEAVRSSVISLAMPYGEGSSSIEDCRQVLVKEGIRFDAKTGRADPGQRAKPTLGPTPKDWKVGAKFMESLPSGSWVSYADFAFASGTTSINKQGDLVGAGQPAANYLLAEWERRFKEGEDHIPNMHRILSQTKVGKEVYGQLKSSWMPDNQAQKTQPLIDIDSINISCSEGEGLEGGGIWTGTVEIIFPLPANWDQCLKQEAAQDFSVRLIETIGEQPAIEALDKQVQSITRQLTRKNDLKIDPLLWIELSD